MNLLKLFIPKENAQEVTELESWTVTWEIYISWSSFDNKKYSKVFINKEDAEEFEKQLKESARFIGCFIDTKLITN